VVQGFGFAALVPLTIGVLVDVVRPERRSHAQSYRVAGMSGAEFVLPLVAGLLVAVTGHWQVPFLLFVIPLVLAALVRRVLPQAAVEHVPLQRGEYGRQAREAARDPLVMSLFVVGFVRWWLKYGFFTFMPLYLYETLGTGVAEIGAVIAVQGLLGAVVSSQTGRLGSDTLARATLVASTVAMGASLVALPLIHQVWWAVAMCMLLGVADGLAGPLMNGLVGILPPASVRTTVIALSGTGRNLGKAVAPSAIGLIIAAMGYSRGFVISGALGLAAPLYLRPLWTPRWSRGGRASL
jgi:predicted MFS family arabinose efflux permease